MNLRLNGQYVGIFKIPSKDTMSEDLLIAKLRKWTYDEVDSKITVDNINQDDFFLPMGWTRHEYADEWFIRWDSRQIIRRDIRLQSRAMYVK